MMSVDYFAVAVRDLKRTFQPALNVGLCLHADAQPIGREDALTIWQCATCKAIWTAPTSHPAEQG